MNHNQKLNQLKEDLEKKGYKCFKNFPIWLLNKLRRIDLSCFKQNKKPIGIEVESNINGQAQVNRLKLKKFKKDNNAIACQFDLKSNSKECF